MIYKITPAFKDYIWGGEKLKKFWNKNTQLERVAESWELSTHKDGMSFADGRPLTEIAGELPVLIKFIDAKANLSVQVHPDDAYARLHENDNGKTEMWYIADSEPGAKLYIGFKHEITLEELKSRIADNTLEEILQAFEVRPGESYFIPARTVHAIGAGITICEIQQSSNVTYRLYDYGRLGSDGKPRPLHIDKAAVVADLGVYTPPVFDGALANCRYFKTFKHNFTFGGSLKANRKSASAITIIDGEGSLNGVDFVRGDTFYIPPGDGVLAFSGKVKLLSTVFNSSK